jgi:hypothetical protein
LEEGDTVTEHEVCYVVHPLTGDQVRIDVNQSWFWEKSWLDMEMEVEQHLAKGEYQDFDTMDDFIADLQELTDNP